ncbi:MAG TPA: FAD-dependent oxidoreductase [Friedmanniella sp.]
MSGRPDPDVDSAESRPKLEQLTSENIASLSAYGVEQDVRVGDTVFRPGDASYDLVVIITGQVQLFSPVGRHDPEVLVAEYGPGGFLGELSLLTGQAVSLVARVSMAGRILRISPVQFRRLMAEDPEISDVMVRTFLARRDLLRRGSAARLLEIIGHAASSEALAVRTFVARRRLPHVWLEADSLAGRALMRSTLLGADDLPAVLSPDDILRRATPASLAEMVGLGYRPVQGAAVDLVVIGAGPAGLAAAVYGASEGLKTVLVDAVGPGGQAAASSRIENYLGFPSGISGADLTQRAILQALKFGARLVSPCRVVELDTSGTQLEVVLDDGSRIPARAVVIATGVRYRGLPLPRWTEFEGTGIYYAATSLEAQAQQSKPVVVVGGANSAGQAALYLASLGSRVSLVVRAGTLSQGMSSYLTDRVRADRRVRVLTSTEVTGLGGVNTLSDVTVTDRTTGIATVEPCHALFCFIGASPATGWRHRVALDDHGFVLTDVQLDTAAEDSVWQSLNRAPLPFETSTPGVFAVGDVRAGSTKRVASAAGEGASVVRSVHMVVGLPV